MSSIYLAILFGLLSMAGYALANVLSQPLARRLGSTQTIFLRGFTVTLLLALVSIPSYHYLTDGTQVLVAFAAGFVGYLPLLAFTHGLKVSKVGVVAPIAGTSPLVTVILAFLILNSPIRTHQWLGIAMVILANIAVSINPRSLRNSNITQLASGIPFALIAALGWGVFFFVVIYPTRALGPWLAAFLVEFGVTLAAAVHLLASKQTVNLKDALAAPVVRNGAFIVVGTAAYTVGVRYFNVSILATLSNSTALLSTLLAAYFFKEHLHRTEKIAAAAMIAGVVLISIQ